MVDIIILAFGFPGVFICLFTVVFVWVFFFLEGLVGGWVPYCCCYYSASVCESVCVCVCVCARAQVCACIHMHVFMHINA